MRTLATLLVGAALLPWPVACTATEAFACNADAQCVSGEVNGRCEPEGVCSFPDEQCPSGHRYGQHSGALSDDCVGEGSSGGTTATTTTTTTTTTVGMTSISPDGTEEAEGSSSGPSTSSTSSTGAATTASLTTDVLTSTTEPVAETTTTTNTTGTELDPYGPCVDASDCPDPASVCIVDMGVVCAPPCDGNGDCPLSPGSNSDPVCTPINGMGMGCVLVCNDADACPADMVCQPVAMMGFGYCAWG